jgi:hypothetical protein
VCVRSVIRSSHGGAILCLVSNTYPSLEETLRAESWAHPRKELTRFGASKYTNETKPLDFPSPSEMFAIMYVHVNRTAASEKGGPLSCATLRRERRALTILTCTQKDKAYGALFYKLINSRPRKITLLQCNSSIGPPFCSPRRTYKCDFSITSWQQWMLKEEDSPCDLVALNFGDTLSSGQHRNFRCQVGPLAVGFLCCSQILQIGRSVCLGQVQGHKLGDKSSAIIGQGQTGQLIQFGLQTVRRGLKAIQFFIGGSIGRIRWRRRWSCRWIRCV